VRLIWRLPRGFYFVEGFVFEEVLVSCGYNSIDVELVVF